MDLEGTDRDRKNLAGTGEQGGLGRDMSEPGLGNKAGLGHGGPGWDRENPVGTQGLRPGRGDTGEGALYLGKGAGFGRQGAVLGEKGGGPRGYLVSGERGGEVVAVEVAAGAQVGEADGLPAAHRRAPLADGRRPAPHPPVAVPVIRRRHPGHRLLPAACRGGRTALRPGAGTGEGRAGVGGMSRYRSRSARRGSAGGHCAAR